MFGKEKFTMFGIVKKQNIALNTMKAVLCLCVISGSTLSCTTGSVASIGLSGGRYAPWYWRYTAVHVSEHSYQW